MRTLTSRSTFAASLLLASTATYAATNRAPVISGTPPATVQVQKTYRFFAAASDADGDTVTFSIANKPSWAWFDARSGTLGGEPKSLGTYGNIVVSATDGKSTVSLPAFSITATVDGKAPQQTGNRAPVLKGSPARQVKVGAAYVFQPKATDPDGDRLAFSVTNKPSWATFSTATGYLMGWPKAGNVGSYSNIVISVSDGKSTVAYPVFNIAVTGTRPATPANGAPTLSGKPDLQVAVGSAYSFQPTASDPNGDTLAFSIVNKPRWATFNTATGRLSGSPQAMDVGTYANIAISVSDGKVVTSLPAFAVAITQISTGSASLSWTPPTQNTDGSALIDLAGYRIYYGTSTASLDQVIEIRNAGVASYLVENLNSGKYYFAVKAYVMSGAESALSGVGTKTIQ